MNMGHDPAYIEKLKEYGKGDPTQSDIEALENELYNAPDRAAAIVMASMVEKALRRLLSNNMREEKSTGKLFKFPGVLSSFSAKINVAYAFKLFGEKTKKELNIIRDLRNQFAHSRLPIEFTTPVVKRCCDELTYPDVPSVLDSVYSRTVVGPLSRDGVDITQPRARYKISCEEIFMRIYLNGKLDA
jgi:hypothetical protein